MLVYQRVTNKNDGFSMGVYEGMRAKLHHHCSRAPRTSGRPLRSSTFMGDVAEKIAVWRKTKHQPTPLPKPIGSMYGIYANIGGILMVNVTIYSIHGSYGKGIFQ